MLAKFSSEGKIIALNALKESWKINLSSPIENLKSNNSKIICKGEFMKAEIKK